MSPEVSLETHAEVSARGCRKNKRGDARSKSRAAPCKYRVTGKGSGSGENFASSERPLGGQQGYPHPALKGSVGHGAITEGVGSNQLSRVGCAQGPSCVDTAERAALTSEYASRVSKRVKIQGRIFRLTSSLPLSLVFELFYSGLRR